MNAKVGSSSSPASAAVASGVLAVVLERMSTAVAVVNAQHRVVWSNPAMTAMRPPTDSDVAGGAWTTDTVERIRPLVEQALQLGRSPGRIRFTAAAPSHPGQLRDWEVETIPIESPEGQPLVAVLILDVTHQRQPSPSEPVRSGQSEQQARDLVDLRASEREKLQFLAVLGHELRNPIGAIHLGVEVLKEALAERLLDGVASGPGRGADEASIGISGNETDDGDAVVESFGMLDRNLRLVRRLIDDLVDYNRGFRGKLSMQVAPVDLCELVKGSIQEFQQDLDEAGLTCGTDFAVDQPCIVQADPDRVRQVIGNLLRNSIRHTPPGGQVTLRLHSTPAADAASDPGQRRIVLDVTDTGEGIDPLLLPRLFEPFVQGETGTGRLGLGLSVCLQIIRAHGGEIHAHSDGHGTGASFRVSFPAPDAIGGQPQA